MSKYMDMDHVKFLLHDVHEISEVLKYDRYADYDKESVDILLDSTKDWTDKRFYPSFREMDEDPARYIDGNIYVHPVVDQVMKEAGENGYIGATFDYDDGGTQMPHMVAGAAAFIMHAANNNLAGYHGLTTGAAHLICSYGSQALKDKWVPNMIAGQWGGTMCLTEPQAGSSLSDIKSSATPNAEGSYDIKGQKIFISGGDRQNCENTIHLFLARIDGAPAGTKGISLFVVPKMRVADDGSLSSNDVITAGDFQKMGQRGYCTTHLVFGEQDGCKGYLVGEANMGLKYMFQMMNGARIDVGITGVGISTAAYYQSLQYANERPQGRKLSASGAKDANQAQTLIVNHPDVRRMLLLQKSVTEGAASLLTECTRLSDMAHNETGEAKEKAHDLLEWLTPIAKTYPSEMGMISINNGLQIYGGYGFCSEFPLQQYYRDIRITSLYEGTTGIQSIDLLGRKSTMNGGRALKLVMAEIQKSMEEASTFDELKPYVAKLGAKLSDMQEVLAHLMPLAMKGEFEKFLSDASVFMEFASTITIAWQWLKMATKAKQAMVTGNTKYSAEFYESKLLTMKFYFTYELPKTNGHKEIIMNTEELTLVKEKELIC